MELIHPNLEYIGHMATFYLPEAKLDSTVRQMIHDHLISHFNAYTVESSNIQGFWRKGPQSPVFGDKNVRYVVSFNGKNRVDSFVTFIAEICTMLGEECIYLTMGKKSWLVTPRYPT
jgi:hypothetical protein